MRHRPFFLYIRSTSPGAAISQPYATNQPAQQQENSPAGQVHRHVPKLTAPAWNKTLMYFINCGQNAAQAKSTAGFQGKFARPAVQRQQKQARQDKIEKHMGRFPFEEGEKQHNSLFPFL
jgi:hypothetical protein